VEACTVTALDAITAFAVPNPNCSSQSQSVFSGLVALQVALVSRSLSLLRTGKVLIKPTLSAVDVCQLKQLLHRCQCFFASLSQISVDVNVENRSGSQPSCNSMQENQFDVLTTEHTSRIVVPAHITHVESCCIRRWRVSRESRSRRHWSGDRWFGRRNDQNQQIDRTSRQQCCRVCCPSRSVAIRCRAWCQNTPRVFRFRSRGQADDGRIHLSQFETLFSALDLPKTSPFARLFHIAHSSWKQR
jgi:hypothetical protein